MNPSFGSQIVFLGRKLLNNFIRAQTLIAYDNPKKPLLKLLVTSTACTLLISLALRGDTPPVLKSHQQSASTAVGALVIPNFRGASDMEICKLRDGVEEQQDGLRELLLEQLEDEHLSPLGRVEPFRCLVPLSLITM
ncbi:MAG TPA: hypothetical protein VF627_02055 [Abditibacterium sp.]